MLDDANFDQNYRKLTPDQREAFDSLVEKLEKIENDQEEYLRRLEQSGH